MSCPFKHMWASEPAAQDTKPDSRNDDLVSDSASKLASLSVKPGTENTDDIKSTETGSSPATCPMGFGALAVASSGEGSSHAAAAPGAPGATCPLGFGSSSGPKLTNLHCMICKSFLYDCVKTNCGHKYCRVCISRFQDCPTCGADVVSVEADAEAQSVVESFLSAHAGDQSIWQIEGTAPTNNEENEEEEKGKAAFLLQVGVRALSGGNPASAAYRLKQCMEELEAQLQNLGKNEEKQEENKNKQQEREVLINKMGAVSGCLGDCYRALGDAEQAIEEYAHSASFLEQIAYSDYSEQEEKEEEKKEEEDENGKPGVSAATAARQALSVTLNKIGEMYHLQGKLDYALIRYKQALFLRQSLLRRLQYEESGNIDSEKLDTKTSVEAALDIAVSHIKVANALETVIAGKKSKIVKEEYILQEQRENEVAAREVLSGVERWIEEKEKEKEDKDSGVDDVKRKVEMLKSHLGT
jgi:tetratricopeptide (TPR) repeat protein